MSKFNDKATGTKTENLAGGAAYAESPALELVSLLLTSFVSDKFYESSNDQLKRLQSLVYQSDKKFAAKAAIYARNEFGMRSITHALIGEITKNVKGEEWVKNAVNKVVRRADDMTEILAYVGNPVPNSLKKGLAEAVHKFDRYQLAKYRGEGKTVKMVDLFNIVHPKPRTKEEYVLFGDLMAGNLKNTQTTEAKMTQVGQKAETEEDKAEMKANVWAEQLNSGKMPYFNLLRNLRNISEQAPEMVDKACELLVDEKSIKNSLVLPFRFQTAIHEVSDRKVISALNQAMEISLANVPKFDGKTLVVLDTSGSMSGNYGTTSNGAAPVEIGGLFGAALYKTNDADFMTFHGVARYENLNPDDTLATITKSISCPGGSTNFNAPFELADKKYDRIIILSDMQGWVGYNSPVSAFNAYKKRTGANPHIYSFDLRGYGTLEFPENQVYCIAGFSEKVFDIMKLLEEDRNALVNKIQHYVEL